MLRTEGLLLAAKTPGPHRPARRAGPAAMRPIRTMRPPELSPRRPQPDSNAIIPQTAREALARRQGRPMEFQMPHGLPHRVPRPDPWGRLASPVREKGAPVEWRAWPTIERANLPQDRQRLPDRLEAGAVVIWQKLPRQAGRRTQPKMAVRRVGRESKRLAGRRTPPMLQPRRLGVVPGSEKVSRQETRLFQENIPVLRPRTAWSTGATSWPWHPRMR